MTAPATPRVSRRPALPLVWVVPVVALLIAGWMMIRQLVNRGPDITIQFANSGGIEAGKTVLEHKGVLVGTVRDVSLNTDLSGVTVRVRLTKQGEVLAREGAQFWVVQPEVSLAGVRGLETLLAGVRLNVRPGNGAAATEFRGLDRPPPIEDPSAGLAFILRAEKLGGLVPGSPVYYRGVKVGAVETTRLSDDATYARIRVRVHSPYADLVRTTSQFWNASGISFKFGLSGAEVKSTTLQSLFAGGVSFASPDADPLSPPALDGTEFTLHAEPAKEWLDWRPRIPIKPVDSSPNGQKSDSLQQANTPGLLR